MATSSMLTGSIATQTQCAERQAFGHLGRCDLAILDGTEHGIQLIELKLLEVQVTEEIGAKGPELLGGFHQPV